MPTHTVTSPLGESVDSGEVDFGVREYVGTVTVAGGAVVSYALTGLSIDLDAYDIEVVAKINKGVSGSARTMELTLNGDAVTQYFSNLTISENTTVSTANGNLCSITKSVTTQEYYTILAKIVLDFSLRPEMYVETNWVEGNSFASGRILRTAGAVAGNIITSITIAASGEPPIENDSVMYVYKRGRLA